MHAAIDRMLREYESGKVSRRALLGTLAALAMSSRTVGLESPLRAKSLNHVTVHVSDVTKSRDFYTRLLNLPVLHDYLNETPPSSYLGLGTSFLCLVQSTAHGIDHFCVGLQTYDPNSAAKMLKAQGLTPDIQDDQVYFRDPDGTRVQLASSEYNG